MSGDARASGGAHHRSWHQRPAKGCEEVLVREDCLFSVLEGPTKPPGEVDTTVISKTEVISHLNHPRFDTVATQEVWQSRVFLLHPALKKLARVARRAPS